MQGFTSDHAGRVLDILYIFLLYLIEYICNIEVKIAYLCTQMFMHMYWINSLLLLLFCYLVFIQYCYVLPLPEINF